MGNFYLMFGRKAQGLAVTSIPALPGNGLKWRLGSSTNHQKAK